MNQPLQTDNHAAQLRKLPRMGLGDIKIEVFKALNERGIDVCQPFDLSDSLNR